ncbi:hypothetical protein ACH4F6_11430 [Streptomyces sp. NPDC017936]|uniref:hypothetical protein n=1 Tax=Streptomyces sp. NPDC017936 TaxID=3365016 RepID=UPI0037A535BF
MLTRFPRRQGAYCRPCGTAAFREMRAHTPLRGWWGPLSLFIPPVTLLMNLGARSTLLRLPEPTAWGGGRPPLDPGRPLSKRPVGVIALLPLD